MALIVSTWLWGDKYGPDHVARLARGVRKHLCQEHRFCVFNPYPQDVALTQMPGCFARLRMFDRQWQKVHGLKEGDRLVGMDLDTVITGPLDSLFDRDEPFVILQGANAANPCPFNGSLQMLRAGAHQEVWSDFSLEAAKTMPFYEFPDDQGWLWHKLPDAAGWKAGPDSGVYAFQKPGWPRGEALPADARLVVFPGWRDPSKFTHLPWVKDNWAA